MSSTPTVTLGFDPARSADKAWRGLWEIPAGRLFVLLWAPSHLISENWGRETLAIAKRVQETRPKTAEELYACFQLTLAEDQMDYNSRDARVFCEEKLGYFTGLESIGYASYDGSFGGVVRLESP